MEVTRQDVIEFLKEHGATLQRTNRHHVWRFPDGRAVTVPVSPSCPFAYANTLSDAKHLLGLTPKEARVGERRVRKSRQRSIQPRWKGFQPARIVKQGFDAEAFKASLPSLKVPQADHRERFVVEHVSASPIEVILRELVTRLRRGNAR